MIITTMKDMYNDVHQLLNRSIAVRMHTEQTGDDMMMTTTILLCVGSLTTLSTAKTNR